MKWRVIMELAGPDGTVQAYEISVGGCAMSDDSSELGADAGGRQEDPGRAAAPSGSGAGGGALPEPAKLPALRGATSAEGRSSPAADIVVWRRGGSFIPLRSLPVRRVASRRTITRPRRSCRTA